MLATPYLNKSPPKSPPDLLWISSGSPLKSPPKSLGRRFGRRFGRWEEKGSPGSDPNSKDAEGGRTYTNGNGIILTCCTEGNANGETSTNPQQTRCCG